MRRGCNAVSCKAFHSNTKRNKLKLLAGVLEVENQMTYEHTHRPKHANMLAIS